MAQWRHDLKESPLLGLSMFTDKDLKFNRSDAKQRGFFISDHAVRL